MVLVLLAVPAFTAVPAKATVIFDFVCTFPATCNLDRHIGFIEFSEDAAASTEFRGTADNWVSFLFTHPERGAFWTLDGLTIEPEMVVFGLSRDRNRILSIENADPSETSIFFDTAGAFLMIRGSPCQNGQCLIRRTPGNDVMLGEWVRRTPFVLSEPGALALFGLGLAGFAVLGRRVKRTHDIQSLGPRPSFTPTLTSGIPLSPPPSPPAFPPPAAQARRCKALGR